MAFIAVLMFAVWSTCVGTQVGIMRDVARVMCAGNQTLLAVRLSSGAVVTGSPNEGKGGRDSYKHRGILQLTALDEVPITSEHLVYDGEPYTFSTVSELLAFGERTLAEETEAPSACKGFSGPCFDDFRSVSYPGTKFATWSMLQYELANSSVSSCADLAYLCYNFQRGSHLA